VATKSPVEVELDVRLVPIAVAQVRVLKSLQRAFHGLASDFEREYGGQRVHDNIAGGLYLLWSTLDVITDLWEGATDDVATVEGWRTALQRISSVAREEEVRAIAQEALASGGPVTVAPAPGVGNRGGGSQSD
jgi:hypothetical protein